MGSGFDTQQASYEVVCVVFITCNKKIQLLKQVLTDPGVPIEKASVPRWMVFWAIQYTQQGL